MDQSSPGNIDSLVKVSSIELESKYREKLSTSTRGLYQSVARVTRFICILLHYGMQIFPLVLAKCTLCSPPTINVCCECIYCRPSSLSPFT